ncbi:MAG: hypothetical protein ICV67_01950 [Thermoleophilia bacterium]|nr:hypothetical protein [Thermoleophilia bacterium]
MIRRAVAALSVLLAAALAVVAVDALRVPGAVAADDARYYGAPRRQVDPWTGIGLPPTRALLGIEDDLGFRKALWAIRRAPRPAEIRGPEQPVLEARAGQAVIRVSEQSRLESDPKRRAVLLNFNGVQLFGRYVSATAFDRERYLREAIGNFRNAVRLDGTFLDGRVNLELALRAAKGSGLAGEDPDAGAARGERAGTGRSGTGY